MSMHINFDDNYNQITTYTGKLKDKYDFLVEVSYSNDSKVYTISSLEWINEPKSKIKSKAEERIKVHVMKWHYGDPEYVPDEMERLEYNKNKLKEKKHESDEENG
jgi:hypothetical protein